MMMDRAGIFPSVGEILLLCLAIWTFGCGLLAVLSFFPAIRPRMTGLWQLMATEILIVGATGLPLALGPGFAIAGLLAFAARTGWESGHVNGVRAHLSEAAAKRLKVLSAVLSVAVTACTWVLVWRWGYSIAVVSIALLLSLVFAARPLRSPLLQVMSLPALPLAALAALITEPRWYPALLVAFLFVEIFDSFALLGGRLFGRRALFPRTSPRKTIEGLLTGLLGLAIVASTLNMFSFRLDWLPFALLLIISTVVAVLGDLAASAPKRAAGVKDYPSLHPQQGGLLDITDSWLVAGPVFCIAVWVAAPWF